ncbi:RecX family transcriptional regulator [Paenibacillus humicola]|uniref:RecX family transcriptional regulator n=1 Tax=Paenibacillus humicola TaxID=3110540 RepID=UPI00237B0BF4|nr:RecX family transcriptional regulator [Paenibacillus humicola]
MNSDSGPRDELRRIASVEQDRKEKRRYHLILDGGDEPFMTVHEDILIRFRLLKGREIHPDELKDIIRENERHRAYALALSYLGARPRTRTEIARYLARKELDEEACRHAVERLQQERLIDDDDYADRFVSERMRSQLKGRRLLQQELMQRGVAKETAKTAAEAQGDDAETEAAVKAARKKWPHLKGELRERKMKLAAFLLRRGFPAPIARRAVQAAAAAPEEDETCQWLDN